MNFTAEKSAFAGLLTSKCDYTQIPEIFIEGSSWVDFAEYEDREYWDDVSIDLKKLIIEKAEIISKSEPVSLTGYDYLLFKQGDSHDLVSQKILSKKTRLEDLILAELLDGKGRFINDISISVWDLCALGNWTGPESQFIQTGKFGLPSLDKILVDELSGEIAGVLSWAYFFFEKEFDYIDPQINKWLVSSVESKFLQPNLESYNFYWMNYQNNTNSLQTPWISYNWLLTSLLLEKNSKNRQKSIYKALECLDQFYKSSPIDGACNGGPELWQYTIGKYFQALELLELVTVGEINVYDNERLKKMGEYICFTHINDDYVYNYAECSPEIAVPPSLVYRFGKKVESDFMKSYAAYLTKKTVDKGIISTGDLFNKINFVVHYSEMSSVEAKQPLAADAYFPESQLVIARSNEGTNEGFFFGMKGGNNNEFGNQNDAGSFILYANGKPLIIDVGKKDKTLSSINNNRYSIWANQSAWHNLPTINGHFESEGENYQVIGLEHYSSSKEVNVSMNMIYAYSLTAGIKSWNRTYHFDRSKGLTINDKFNLEKVLGETYVSFMAFVKPKNVKPGVLLFTIDKEQYELTFDSSFFEVEVEEVSTQDDAYLQAWNSPLFRIVLKPSSPVLSGNWIYAFAKK